MGSGGDSAISLGLIVNRSEHTCRQCATDFGLNRVAGQAIMTVPKNDKSGDYARYAEHCLKMAAAITDQESRRIQREMAGEWLRLADTKLGALVGPRNANGMTSGRAKAYLAALWPNQGADVIPTDKKTKTSARPHWGLVRTLNRTGAWGAGGLGKRPAFVDFDPVHFRNLYQIAHSERRWKNATRSGPNNLKTEGIACQPK